MKLCLPPILDGEDKSSPLKNRIRKNYQHIRKWAKRTETDCFRIYDRDIKEYPLVIDFYSGRFCVHYFVYDQDFNELKNLTLRSLCSIFGTNIEIYERNRIRRKKTEQYEKSEKEQQFFIVSEYGVKFKINLVNYVDTGLFLDHRETRQIVASQVKGKRLLNLFAYTCAFSVHAALAGASYTKSVDLSNTYTSWGRENFLLNSLSFKTNDIVRADCLKFIESEILSGQLYDVIIIDPPTLSRSKKMNKMFDIQKDYIPILLNALKILAKEGTIFFSTNARDFRFDTSFFNECIVQEITEKTLPLDFHNRKIHKCWKINFNKNYEQNPSRSANYIHTIVGN